MTSWYVDTDLASANGDGAGTGWGESTADKSLEYAIETRASAGDIIYFQGAAADSYGAALTLSSPGTTHLPVTIIGCINGTTNEGVNIVAADLADRASANLPVISTSSGNINMSGNLQFFGVEIIPTAVLQINSDTELFCANCDITLGASQTLSLAGGPCMVYFQDCEVVAHYINATGAGTFFYMNGGILTTAATFALDLLRGRFVLVGVDMSATSSTKMAEGGAQQGSIEFKNCEFPSGYALVSSAISNNSGPLSSYVEAIGCSVAGAVGSTDSKQDYEYEGPCGTVDIETTVVRTGGATDGALGQFAYKMVNLASKAMPGTMAFVTSPWFSVWVAGGSSTTLTVFTTHDNAGTINRDLYEGELQVDFYTPDDSDSPAHKETLDPGLGRYLPEGTVVAGTDDTTSTWVTYNTYKRSFAATVTPGYTGWAYARVRLAYNSATPVTVYVEPLIVVT